MAKKYEGVRERVAGKRYEVFWRPFRGAARIFRNIEALSLSEAFYKRQQLISEHSTTLPIPNEDRRRLSSGFIEIWEGVERDIAGDNRAKKTVAHYKNAYWRVFGDFKSKYYPGIQSLSQLHSAFFSEYKNYYVVELNKTTGWRAELIFIKAIVRRLYKLGYCSRELLEKLCEIKTPRGNRRDFPNITHTQIKDLFTYIKKDRPDYYRPLEFIRRTGRRRKEVTLIRKDDVILDGLRPVAINIRAETTKMREKAPLKYLDDNLAKLIQGALSNNKTEWLFSNRCKRRCDPDKLYQYLKKTSKAIISAEITPHYFRHRFFTECGKANLSIADVKAISGIRDTKVLLEYYSHSTDEGQAKVLEKTKL